MKKLIFIFVLIGFYSCDDETKKKYEFIEKIISNPDNYENIIKSSKFYYERDFYYLNVDEMIRMKNHIKEFFNNQKFSVIYNKFYVYEDKNKNNFRFNNILLRSIIGENEFYISFIFINGEWKLTEIARGEPRIDPPDDMEDK